MRLLLASLSWTSIVIILSLAPPRVIPKPEISIEGLDKVVHFVMYVVFVFLWIVTLKKHFGFKRGVLFYSVLGGFLLGFILELIQEEFIKNRYFEGADLIANGFGCIFGVVLVTFLKKHTKFSWLDF